MYCKYYKCVAISKKKKRRKRINKSYFTQGTSSLTWTFDTMIYLSVKSNSFVDENC